MSPENSKQKLRTCARSAQLFRTKPLIINKITFKKNFRKNAQFYLIVSIVIVSKQFAAHKPFENDSGVMKFDTLHVIPRRGYRFVATANPHNTHPVAGATIRVRRMILPIF